jgi:hypothetical protein
MERADRATIEVSRPAAFGDAAQRAALRVVVRGRRLLPLRISTRVRQEPPSPDSMRPRWRDGRSRVAVWSGMGVRFVLHAIGYRSFPRGSRLTPCATPRHGLAYVIAATNSRAMACSPSSLATSPKATTNATWSFTCTHSWRVSAPLLKYARSPIPLTSTV